MNLTRDLAQQRRNTPAIESTALVILGRDEHSYRCPAFVDGNDPLARYHSSFSSQRRRYSGLRSMPMCSRVRDQDTAPADVASRRGEMA